MVLAITALLVSLAIPSLIQARETTYIVTCGNNMRMAGTGLINYAYDWKESIPPNCSRNDGEIIPVSGARISTGIGGTSADPYGGWNAGPYTNLDKLNTLTIGCESNRGNQARLDSYADYTYTNGLALVWGTGYITYDLAGARALWCPAERNARFMGRSANSQIYGPGTFWRPNGSNFGLIDCPTSTIQYGGVGNTAANFTLIISYAYRSIGGNIANENYAMPQTLAKGSWKISNLSKYCAAVDYCSCINGSDGSTHPVIPIYSHGSSTLTYMGVNRLFYDGHAKWLNDPTAAYTNYLGAKYFPNTMKETIWRNLYDVK